MRRKLSVCGVVLWCGLWLLLPACQDEGSFPPPTMNMIAPIPSWLGIDYEDITFANARGENVHGWFIPAENAKATVLLHHGAVSNRSTTVGQYALLHDSGYNVMVYDYQGFGENANTPSLSTILPDANAALAYLQQRTGPGSDKIILLGASLGTLPAIAQAAQSPDRVIGVVLEGSFVLEGLPPWSLLFAGIVPWENAVKYMPSELDPGQYIANITIPKVFLQSSEDLVTPFEGARQLCDAAPAPKLFIEITGLHLGAVLTDPNYPDDLQRAFEYVLAND